MARILFHAYGCTEQENHFNGKQWFALLIIFDNFVIFTIGVASLGQRSVDVFIFFLSTPVRPCEREIPRPGDAILTCKRTNCIELS